jgi:hypothetical protein
MPRSNGNGKMGPAGAMKVPRYAGAATFVRLPEIDDVSDVDHERCRYGCAAPDRQLRLPTIRISQSVTRKLG